MKLKYLLEGDVVKFPKKTASQNSDYHLGKMREHAQMAKVHDNLMSHNARIQEMDDHLKGLHAELASNHAAAALIHGAIKNHHFKKYKESKAEEDSRGHQSTNNLPSNAVRLRK